MPSSQDEDPRTENLAVQGGEINISSTTLFQTPIHTWKTAAKTLPRTEIDRITDHNGHRTEKENPVKKKRKSLRSEFGPVAFSRYQRDLQVPHQRRIVPCCGGGSVRLLLPLPGWDSTLPSIRSPLSQFPQFWGAFVMHPTPQSCFPPQQSRLCRPDNPGNRATWGAA